MEHIKAKIQSANWEQITSSLEEKGFAHIPNLLTDKQCETLKENYNHPAIYRKTVVMERHRFGLGAYKYFCYPLPGLLQQIRTNIYPYLAPTANRWFQSLGLDQSFPLSHETLLKQCAENNQRKPTVLLLKYGKGGYNTLHQDLYGPVFFPLQLVLLLSDPHQDFSGGEFVLTQQVPRAQSKAIVLTPQKGDALIFTTNFKSEKGTKGYYRVNMKHGVSEIYHGERYALGIIFHDATD